MGSRSVVGRVTVVLPPTTQHTHTHAHTHTHTHTHDANVLIPGISESSLIKLSKRGLADGIKLRILQRGRLLCATWVT
jgi:hypothetical protein